MHTYCRTLRTHLAGNLAPDISVEPDFKSAHDACDTHEVATYLYGVVQHMQNMYDNGARVTNVALHPKLMK